MFFLLIDFIYKRNKSWPVDRAISVKDILVYIIKGFILTFRQIYINQLKTGSYGQDINLICIITVYKNECTINEIS